MASETLTEVEKLGSPEREAHEVAVAETLGTMYIGLLFQRSASVFRF
jgi:hypothetical protein